MIRPHVIDEEDLLEHCMLLGKLVLDMRKVRNFLGNL